MSQYDDDADKFYGADDRDNEEWEEIEGRVMKETPANDKNEGAIFVDFGDGIKEWIPKSQCDDWPDEGDTGFIRMKTWLAEEKGLI